MSIYNQNHNGEKQGMRGQSGGREGNVSINFSGNISHARGLLAGPHTHISSTSVPSRH